MKNTGLKVIGTVLRFTMNIAFVVVGIYLVYYFAMYAFNFSKGISASAVDASRTAKEVSVVIPDGSNTQDIAEILYEKGLVDNVALFRIQSRLDNMDSLYKAGTYLLNTNMANEDLMQIIAEGSDAQENTLKITIPEGYTAAQIGNYLEESGICTAEEFRTAMNTVEYDYAFLEGMPERNTRLEGYLFPDTYAVYADITPEEIISKMLARFEQVYEEENAQKTVDLPIDEIVTRASIIEAEIRVDEERPICASVIQNRLDMGMPLQMDATVLYGLGERKTRLFVEDLQVDSPYNTYKNPGLPVGPICNPGRAAIKAALNPADTNYVYYVVNDLAVGSHEYTEDYDSFLAAKERYKNLVNN